MKVTPLFGIGIGAAALLLLTGAGKSKPSAPTTLVQGKAYRAVFDVPEALKPHMTDVSKLMPAGSDLVLDGSRLQVRFIAPTSKAPGDIPTPFGTLKLVMLEEMG
jgi:hypothetical protein